MKKQASIKSVESRITVPDNILVNAITRWKRPETNLPHKETGYLPQGFDDFSWSSAFSKLHGTTEIVFVSGADEKMQYINIPFEAWFLFTCTKEKESGYKIGWGVSLS